MKINKVLVVFPLLPSYDIDFFIELNKYSNFKIYVAADIKSKNQLTMNSYSNFGFDVFHTELINFGPFSYTTGLFKIIKSVKPDLILYSASPRDIGQFFSIIYQKILNRRRIGAWSMFHRIGGPILYSSIYYRFLGTIMDINLCYSNIGKNIQIDRGVKKSKIFVVGTAINENKVIKAKKLLNNNSVTKLIKKYNLQEKKILIQVVRLTKIKKPFLLIDMISKLKEKFTNFKLILIGGGILENDVKNYVKKLGLENYILFLGPIYDENQLSLWFKISDVFVIPTCVGLSAHHAFCYNIPIVTDNSLTNQASESDILIDNYNSLLYEENNLDDFCLKILTLLNDNKLYAKLSFNTIKTIKSKHSLKNKVTNFINAINYLQ